jgi:type II secretory pathway pseudopilin PulG
MQTGKPARGFALIALLALIAIVGTGLAVVGQTWQHTLKRERERQLMHIGGLYANAIEAYYLRAPGNGKAYPMGVSDLLADSRFVAIVRHLRQPYPDPVSPGSPFREIRNSSGQLVGVASTSLEPMLLSATDGPPIRYTDYAFLAPSASKQQTQRPQ